MKSINNYIIEKFKINSKTSHNEYNFNNVDDLAEALLKRFEGYGEFENIVDDHTFHVSMEDNKEDLNFWKKRLKKYKGLFDYHGEEKEPWGLGEITWTWSLDDFDDIDYELYKNICELFDFLK